MPATTLEILKMPHPMLRQKCDQVATKEVIYATGLSMIETMHDNRGVGLAAPQVGLALDLFVMRMGDEDKICYQPRIIEKSKKLSNHLEECLSIPGVQVSVSRPRRIKVSFSDGHATTVMDLSHLEARVFQHELDHLNGVLIIDHFFKQ